jgi:rubrerythrin
MNFQLWHQYFLSNQNHFNYIDWTANELLSDKERKIITSSIRQFQRGEHSEGKHFLQFAKTMNDESYIETVKVFIKEEQDHAIVLGKFMEQQGIDKLKKDWLDNTFRWLRKLAGLEGTITVLLTAEIISMIYYKALHRVTNSYLLQQLCGQILIDEEMHLQFQSYTLQVLYKRKAGMAVQFSGLLHTILMAGTIVMVWFYHRKVLKSGRYHFFSFFAAVWKEFRECRKIMASGVPSLPGFAAATISAAPLLQKITV